VVVQAGGGWNGGYGTMVVIDHGNGYRTLYAHLSRLNVSVGQTVEQGEVIGAVGTTGIVTGPHLHFEVYRGGVPINPLSVLP
jgi:murein DD-endopeptidase MepM/ murein hydrolase activator NlpD